MIGANFMAAILQKLKERYALDIRALSLMRIVIALVLLADLCIRSTSLRAFYTHEGIVPYPEVELAFWRNSYFSFFTLNGEFWYAAFLFIITGLIYFCLLIGYRTRIFSILAWVMLISLQNCNSAILQCGDDELRLILFWGIFLPWGNFYSIDSKRYPGLQSETKYFDVPGIAYVLLIFSVYFFTGFLKDSPEWDSREGSAFYYALNLDQMTWPLGKMLLSYPGLLKIFTLSAKWLEVCGPLLLFIPFKNSWFRMLFFFVFAAFQITISLTLFVGLFYIISIGSLIGLLSQRVMDKLETLFKIKRPVLTENDIQFPGLEFAKNYYFRVIKNSFVCFCIALCLIWNLGSIEGSGLRVSDKAFSFGFFLRLDQHWNMFAPRVLKEDGWFVMEGITPDKKHIDVNREGAPADFTKPQSVLKYIKDDRWRKYYENYVFIDNLFMRPYYCNYLLKEWNQEHPDNKVDTMNVIFMHETTLPPGEPLTIRKENLCKCGK